MIETLLAISLATSSFEPPQLPETQIEHCRGRGCGRGTGRRGVRWYSKSAQYWLLEWSTDVGRTYQSQRYNT